MYLIEIKYILTFRPIKVNQIFTDVLYILAEITRTKSDRKEVQNNQVDIHECCRKTLERSVDTGQYSHGIIARQRQKSTRLPTERR